MTKDPAAISNFVHLAFHLDGGCCTVEHWYSGTPHINVLLHI